MTTCMHAKVHEEFFVLLAGAPSLWKFPYLINVLPTKRCSFSITLVWFPYVYSPCPEPRKQTCARTLDTYKG